MSSFDNQVAGENALAALQSTAVLYLYFLFALSHSTLRTSSVQQRPVTDTLHLARKLMCFLYCNVFNNTEH